jgi:hypothetical protein
MKVCKKCSREKTQTGTRWGCKPCDAERAKLKWHSSAATRERKYAASANQRKRNRQFIWEYLKTHPCIACGEPDPVVLDFDHRDPNTKHLEICEMRTRSLQTIAVEIAKCDVLCANCHRRRTAKQQGWYKNL